MSNDYDTAVVTGASLSGVDILADLTPAEREEVATRSRGRRYQAGSQIVSHEDTDRDVFFIISGTVRVTFFSAGGKEISFRDQHAGEMFGEMTAIDEAGRSAYVVALEETIIATMSQGDFLDTLTRFPAVALATLRRLTGLVRRLTERVIEFSTLGVKNRIHAELLRLSHEARRDGARAIISPAPKHAEIASRVSTHREAVTRELGELARSGLVARSDNTLTIEDVGRLERLVRDVATG